MKKIIIAATVILTTGILASCNKQPEPKTIATYEHSTALYKKDIGTAD